MLLPPVFQAKCAPCPKYVVADSFRSKLGSVGWKFVQIKIGKWYFLKLFLLVKDWAELNRAEKASWELSNFCVGIPDGIIAENSYCSTYCLLYVLILNEGCWYRLHSMHRFHNKDSKLLAAYYRSLQ